MRLIDADALSEKLCKTTIFVKDGEKFQRMINDAPTVSAEARPTVIRSKTLMPTKDFNEWAKRIRETNPDAVVIPCDAEVVSAEAVEVVRCKDCKYWKEWESRTGSCHRSENGYNWFGVDSTDYCSFGEKKDGEA